MLTTSRVVGLALALAAPALSLPAAHAAPAADAITQVATPMVIGHRGASGYRPEHTLAAYRLAIQMGANYVEPDLVSTKDHVLVARHENEISGTTDVKDRPEFADRKVTKLIDGVTVTGWFTEDFALAELKTLRAKERLPQVRPDNTAYDGRFEVPTLQEVLNLVRAESHRRHRTIGVYPETKHPTYFDSIGLSLEEPLVAALEKYDLDDADDAVVIQSFETANLVELNTMIDSPIAQLINSGGQPWDFTVAGDPRTYRDLTSAANLEWISTYADGVGVNKDLVLPRDPVTGATSTLSALVGDAHAAGLLVHIWTLRAENQFMATNFRSSSNPNEYGDLAAEITAFLDAGIDGLFSDQPDLAVAARDAWLS